MDGFLTRQEAAEYLGIAVITLDGWKARRKVPHHKVGAKVWFKEADLERFVNQDCRIDAVV